MAEQQIDPRFFLPPNVVDLEYKDTTSESETQPKEYDSSAVDVDIIVTDTDFPFEEVDYDADASDEDRLLPPDFITLVSQTARVTSGGTVVDVVIDVEDVARVSQFEVRLTK